MIHRMYSLTFWCRYPRTIDPGKAFRKFLSDIDYGIVQDEEDLRRMVECFERRGTFKVVPNPDRANGKAEFSNPSKTSILGFHTSGFGEGQPPMRPHLARGDDPTFMMFFHEIRPWTLNEIDRTILVLLPILSFSQHFQVVHGGTTEAGRSLWSPSAGRYPPEWSIWPLNVFDLPTYGREFTRRLNSFAKRHRDTWELLIIADRTACLRRPFDDIVTGKVTRPPILGIDVAATRKLLDKHFRGHKEQYPSMMAGQDGGYPYL